MEKSRWFRPESGILPDYSHNLENSIHTARGEKFIVLLSCEHVKLGGIAVGKIEEGI